MTTATQPPDELKTRKVEMILQQLDTLPTLPAVALRLLTLTAGGGGGVETKISEVVELLSADQALTVKLLSLASSASAGGSSGGKGGDSIMTVQQAVVRLGFETVRNLVLSIKVFEAFQRREDRAEKPVAGAADVTEHKESFDREEFWKHSLAVATAAEMLAGRSKPKLNVHDAFVCGLLHDVGKVAFDTAMPKSFARVVETATLTRGDVADIERRIIGMDHALAGKRLAEAWNLPSMITQVIWLHGAPPMPGSGGAATVQGAKGGGLVNMPLVLVVGLADLLVRRQHIGFSGNFLFPYESSQYMNPLGLTERDVEDVTAHLAEALEKKARGIGLHDVESRQLYLESIANANAELGRVNHTLATQNRKLAIRSACFELMTRFYQRIGPSASPAQLLREIGQVSHGFLDSGRLVLFSQDADQPMDERAKQGFGEVVLFDSERAAQEGFLMAMPAFGGDQRVRGSRSMAAGGEEALRNFTRPATPQLDWLMERVQHFLGTSHCWFMPLLCGNEPVGGIVWLAKETANSMQGISDLVLVSQSLGMTLRTAQIREQQMVLTESLAAANRELGAVQQQLVRAKSLASLGEMAAGAAHEMNNPLAVVCGRAQLLAAKISDPGMKQEASLIAQQGDRLSQIITDMMEFAKPHPPKIAELSMQIVVEEAVKAARERAGVASAHIPIHIEPGAGIPPPPCHGDAKQIRNAITEVLLNAIQASQAHPAPGSPNVTAATAQNGGDIRVQLRFDPLDAQLIVQIVDHGVGMSEDVMRQAFSPFFSVKSAGRNRGMGLPKALRWVENHGGTIRLDSAPGSGTTAILILPVGAAQ